MMNTAGKTQSEKNNLISWRVLADGQTATTGQFWTSVLLFSLAAILFQLGAHFLNYTDYVGPDPDDAMRLVEVRDYLGGQSWFDLHQFRLGPDGGTLMHWSRLIDWPIAMLILLFSQFLSPQTAEAVALVVWPVALIIPLMASAGLASYRLGGKGAMLIGLALSALFLAAIIRFRPGAIDHHNVQLILATFIAAMLLDPKARAASFAAAAIAGALALAIGAETTPMLAVSAVVVALLWTVHGERYRNAAIGFGLTFALATAVVLLGTTPIRMIGAVTCDTLSMGYFSLVFAGGVTLALSAISVSERTPTVRIAALAGIGAVTLGVALVVAPQCLHNPLSDLDPLLQTLWLSSVTEAQSIVAEMAVNPETIGGFYAVGLIALAVCAMRIVRGEEVLPHAVLFALIAISWAVTALQIRGMIFANFLAFIPLSALISDLRDLYKSRQKDARAAFAFVMSVLASVPTVWTVGGVLAFEAGHAVAGIAKKDSAIEKEEARPCVTQSSLQELAGMTPGRILSTSNPGSALLRFTPHSVLTANYHRNQSGMVAALKMQMATPADARELLAQQDIRYVLICSNDPTVGMMKAKYPDGLFAAIATGQVPDYLELVSTGSDGLLRVFAVKPQ